MLHGAQPRQRAARQRRLQLGGQVDRPVEMIVVVLLLVNEGCVARRAPGAGEEPGVGGGAWEATGLNTTFRICRYGPGAKRAIKTHTAERAFSLRRNSPGAPPGRRVLRATSRRRLLFLADAPLHLHVHDIPLSGRRLHRRYASFFDLIWRRLLDTGPIQAASHLPHTAVRRHSTSRPQPLIRQARRVSSTSARRRSTSPPTRQR